MVSDLFLSVYIQYLTASVSAGFRKDYDSKDLVGLCRFRKHKKRPNIRVNQCPILLISQ